MMIVITLFKKHFRITLATFRTIVIRLKTHSTFILDSFNATPVWKQIAIVYNNKFYYKRLRIASHLAVTSSKCSVKLEYSGYCKLFVHCCCWNSKLFTRCCCWNGELLVKFVRGVRAGAEPKSFFTHDKIDKSIER